jgi:hypothetical protein
MPSNTFHPQGGVVAGGEAEVTVQYLGGHGFYIEEVFDQRLKVRRDDEEMLQLIPHFMKAIEATI